MVSHLIAWLEASPGSVALRESLYAYSVTETLHVLTLTLFLGTLALFDLRLMGLLFQRAPVSRLSRRVLPFSVGGFCVMVLTGLALFYANPIRLFHSVWFRAKLALLLAAGLNMAYFHLRVERDRALWDASPVPPPAARRAGAISLVLWTGVIVMGRLIAYGWFDCDRLDPGWLARFAQCAVGAR
jgi:hypothetical protein